MNTILSKHTNQGLNLATIFLTSLSDTFPDKIKKDCTLLRFEDKIKNWKPVH